MIYLITEHGDSNHLDGVTRERMHDASGEAQFFKLVKLGWFFIGMVCGSALHDILFHSIEQVIK